MESYNETRKQGMKQYFPVSYAFPAGVVLSRCCEETMIAYILAYINGASEITWQAGRFEQETGIELFQMLLFESVTQGISYQFVITPKLFSLMATVGSLTTGNKIFILNCTCRFASIQCFQIGQNFVNTQCEICQVHF